MEDRAFLECVENSMVHLESLGYDTSHAYTKTAGCTPKTFAGIPYGHHLPLPAYMKESSFFNGTSDVIVNAINNGSFLVAHYDHGNADGWQHPVFNTANISSLTNSNLLPIVYSIDCLVGEYYWYNSSKEGNKNCFAERIMRKESGGALGVIAAQRTTYSGNNYALYYGLIDATCLSTSQQNSLTRL